MKHGPLARLDLNDCKSLEHLKGVWDLPALTEITLRNCESLTDVSALAGLPSLEKIELPGCTALRDISALADLPKLKYAEMIVTEAMRLYPPAYGLGRQTIKPTEVAGHRIPVGVIVVVPTWVVHRDARFYGYEGWRRLVRLAARPVFRRRMRPNLRKAS